MLTVNHTSTLYTYFWGRYNQGYFNSIVLSSTVSSTVITPKKKPNKPIKNNRHQTREREGAHRSSHFSIQLLLLLY